MALFRRTPEPIPEKRNILLTNSTSVGQTYIQPWETKRWAKQAARETLVASITNAIASDVSDIARFPITVRELGTDRDVTDTHWLGRAWNIGSAAGVTASSLRAAASLQLDYVGEAYLVIVNERIVPLVGGTVEIITARAGSTYADGTPALIAGYIVRSDSGLELGRYDAMGMAQSGQAIGQLMRVHYPTPGDPFRADAPVARAGVPIEVVSASRQATAAVLRNAGIPGVIVSVDDETISLEELEALERRINSRISDPSARGRSMAVNATTAIDVITDSGPGEGWVSLAAEARADILRTWFMPSSRLGDLGGVTYENQKVANAAYLRNTVLARLGLIASALNTVARAQGYYVEFEGLDPSLADDLSEVATRAADLYAAGIITLNESREMVGLPPVDGGDNIDTHNDEDTPPVGGGTPPFSDGSETARTAPLTRATAKQPTAEEFDLMFDAVVGAGEDTLGQFAQRYHARLWRNIAGALKKAQGRAAEGAPEETSIAAKVTAAELLNAVARDKELAADLPALLESIIGDTAAGVADSIGTTVDMSRPSWRRILEERMNSLIRGDRGQGIRGWNPALVEDIQDAIDAGYAAGESMDGIGARIAQALGVDPANPGALGPRAERIARTEVIGLANETAQETYGQSGVVRAKRWNAAGDSRTRESHLSANGQEVPLDGKFSVGGVMMSHPGDRSAPAAEVVNCRCRTVPVVSAEYL